MGISSIALALALCSLAGLAALLGWRAEGRRARRTRTALLALVALASLFSYLRTPTRDESGRLGVQLMPLHTHEYFHYFLGTRYFAELGHDRLYEAIVIADAEDAPERFRPHNRFRDLRTNRVDRTRADVLREGALARRAFSPERWQQFKSDVALFRTAFPPEAWYGSGLLRDHGYNGMPLTTLVLGALANQPFVDSYTFIQVARWLDLVAMCAVGLLLAAAIGVDATLVFATLWFANPFNGSPFVGGAYLRYGYSLALVVAWLCLEKRRLAPAGALLALATHLRVFPALFAVGLLLRDLVSQQPLRALRAHRRLYASYLLTGLALFAVTLPLQGPDGRSVWRESLERIRVHSGAYSTNGVGLAALFAWSGAHEPARLQAAAARGEIASWSDAVERTVSSRRIWHWPLLGAILIGCATLARRLSLAEAMFLGFPLSFALLYLSHYYYMHLALIALVFRDDRRILLTTTLATGLFLVTATPTLFADDALRFTVLSGELLAMLCAVAAFAALRSGRRDRRATP